MAEQTGARRWLGGWGFRYILFVKMCDVSLKIPSTAHTVVVGSERQKECVPLIGVSDQVGVRAAVSVLAVVSSCSSQVSSQV